MPPNVKEQSCFAVQDCFLRRRRHGHRHVLDRSTVYSSRDRIPTTAARRGNNPVEPQFCSSLFLVLMTRTGPLFYVSPLLVPLPPLFAPEYRMAMRRLLVMPRSASFLIPLLLDLVILTILPSCQGQQLPDRPFPAIFLALVLGMILTRSQPRPNEKVTGPMSSHEKQGYIRMMG